jgi:hypothetical protein
MKRKIAILAALMLTTMSVTTFAQTSTTLPITTNTTSVTKPEIKPVQVFTMPVIIDNGTAYIQANELAKKLGMTVKYNANKPIDLPVISRKDVVIWLDFIPRIGYPKVNARYIQTNSICKLINKTLYLPAKFVLENMNCTFKLNSNKTITITNNGFIKPELVAEDVKVRDISGQVIDQNGKPAKNAKVNFFPVSASGALWGDSYYTKYNLAKIQPVYTDENGIYTFKNIDIEKFPFAGIGTGDTATSDVLWIGVVGWEVDTDMLNNEKQVPMSPLKINLRRAKMSTIYLYKNEWYGK